MTSLIDLPQPGENNTITAVIEIPSGSRQKIEYDQDNDCFRLDRMLPIAMPANYGFVPRTVCDDGDAMDILVLGNDVFATGTVLEVKPIGILYMIDEDQYDPKVLSIPDYMELSELDMCVRDGRRTRSIYGNIINFFKQYKGEGHTTVGDTVYPVTNAVLEIDEALIEYFKETRQ